MCVSPGKMRAFEEGRPVVEGVLNAVRDSTPIAALQYHLSLHLTFS